VLNFLRTHYFTPLILLKANTLLADHLFSPGLFLAERIERGLISAHRLAGRSTGCILSGLNNSRPVIELGAGCALPSLLMSTLTSPPSIIVVTDYPDPGILGNLVRNVDRNKNLVVPGCSVKYCGYNWGTDPASLLCVAKIAKHQLEIYHCNIGR
jgi:nicotinamide N-methyltransferase